MLNIEYLYGSEVPLCIPTEIIEDRVAKLDRNLTELLSVDWRVRDDKRVNAVLKAKEFWLKINEK